MHHGQKATGRQIQPRATGYSDPNVKHDKLRTGSPKKLIFSHFLLRSMQMERQKKYRGTCYKKVKTQPKIHLKCIHTCTWPLSLTSNTYCSGDDPVFPGYKLGHSDRQITQLERFHHRLRTQQPKRGNQHYRRSIKNLDESNMKRLCVCVCVCVCV